MSVVAIEMNKHGVATVTLNRPDVHNALNEVMIHELTECMHMLGRHASVRVIVLTGAGKSFSAGADLNWMRRAASQDEEANRADALRLAGLFETINTCPRPVVGIVNGAVLGGGIGLVACCDIVIADTRSQFGLTEVRIGLIPATISPYVITRIGVAHARRYMLTAERFDAATAHAIGLVHQVSDTPLEAVMPVIAALLQNGPQAMIDTKALIADVAGKAITPDLMTMTAQRIAARRASDEGREGIAAFLEKRKPNWVQD